MTQNFARTSELNDVTLTLEEGTRGLVSPCSGRMLGLYTCNSDENFFWTKPSGRRSARSEGIPEHSSTDWGNWGGDRTWLAPEIQLFIEDLERPLETYSVQRALDPGSWKLAYDSVSEISLANEGRVRLHRSGRKLGFRMRKSFSAAANPLQDTPLADAGLEFAGYTQKTKLMQEALPDRAVRLGIWNLLQLPFPGVMVVPTRAATQPRLVFGALCEGECSADSRVLRWNMDAPGENTKIALKPQLLTGRAGYFRKSKSGNTADLVVREFAVDPDGDYVDALWDAPHESGWAFQACSVRQGDDRFNELEYHAPIPASFAGEQTDESRVWAFRGPSDTIAEASVSLLGVSPFAQSGRELHKP